MQQMLVPLIFVRKKKHLKSQAVRAKDYGMSLELEPQCIFWMTQKAFILIQP